jgi:hypothetical protein
LCSSSNTSKSLSDSIEITFLGLLNEESKLVYSPSDSIIFSEITKIHFGKFSLLNDSIPHSIRLVTNKSGNNSESLVKSKLISDPTSFLSKMVTIYFKDEVDSVEIDKWLSKKAFKIITDSVIYISKEAAQKRYDENIDSAWHQFISTNPLPTSVELYIKESSFNQQFLNIFIRDLKKEKIVSEVYSNFETVDGIDKLAKSFLLIKIRT